MRADDDRTHASFFSGVGGLDLGLERAGWRTVSFSEIDPYASAVLAERWPGVPNLGDITDLARAGLRGREAGQDTADADLWTGGFPCEDLSVAGKRRGMGAGTRSGLAFVFLDLMERYRPPAALLENVPGLLSSHGGRDMARLLGEMVELGYGVAYRVLDARWFGVPQRRRRVFILGLRSDPDDPDGHLAAERAAEVLAVGTRCRRHPPTGIAQGEEPADGVGGGVDEPRILRQAISAKWHKGTSGPAGDEHHNLIAGPSPDARGVRAPDGLAGGLDDSGGLAATLNSGGSGGGFRTEPGGHLVVSESGSGWRSPGVSALRSQAGGTPAQMAMGTFAIGDDPLLPPGLDSHRYRCCGNGVVAPVAEWIGRRLMAALGLGR